MTIIRFFILCGWVVLLSTFSISQTYANERNIKNGITDELHDKTKESPPPHTNAGNGQALADDKTANFDILGSKLPLQGQLTDQQLHNSVLFFYNRGFQTARGDDSYDPKLLSPFSVDVISASEIQKMGALTFSDLLRKISGVNVSEGPMGTTVNIRGFSSDPFSKGVLFMVDGIPYNSPDKGGLLGFPGGSLLPIESISQLEVIKGPVSAMFGANAFWGVINIVTKSASDVASGQGGSIKAGVGTFNRTNFNIDVIMNDLPFINDGILSYNTTTYLGPLDYRYSGIDVANNDSPAVKETNYKFKLNFADWLSITGFSRAENAWGTTHNKNKALYIGGYNDSWVPESVIDYKLAQVSREGSVCWQCHNTGVPNSLESTTRYFGTFRIKSENFMKELHSSMLIAGVEYRNDKVEESAENNLQNLNVTNIGFFTEAAASMNPEWLLMLGGRLDYNSDIRNTVSSHANLIWRPAEKTNVRLSRNDAFRNPVTHEQFINGSLGNNGPTIAGDPTIQQENITSYELSIEHRFELEESTDDDESRELTLKGNLFSNRIENYIETFVTASSPRGAATALMYRNSPDAVQVEGSEIQVIWNLADIAGFKPKIDISYSYQKTRRIGATTPMTYAPEAKAHGAVFLESEYPYLPSIEMEVNYVGKQYPSNYMIGVNQRSNPDFARLYQVGDKLKAYSLYNLTFSKHIQNKGTSRGFLAKAGIRNIFATRAVERLDTGSLAADGQPRSNLKGREFFMSLSYSF